MTRRFRDRCIAVMLVSIAPVVAFAQSADTEAPSEIRPFIPVPPQPPEIRRAPLSNKSDAPTPPVKIVIPAPAGVFTATGEWNPPDEFDNEPPKELDQEPPAEDLEPPTFFGEPVLGKFVWVLDRSGSMGVHDNGSGPIEDAGGGMLTNPTRIQILKAECVKVLRRLTEDNWFAIVSFGYGPDVSFYSALVQGTSSNVDQGIATVNNLMASGGTPAYQALMRSCFQYTDHELSKIYFLCDGSPTAGGSAQEILIAFPGWFAPQKQVGCELVCIHIGGDQTSANFMQTLANSAGGTYIKK